MSDQPERVKRIVGRLRRGSAVLALAGVVTAGVVAAAAAWAAEPAAAPAGSEVWGYVSAALAVGVGCIGAGYAVATVGAASMGAVSERPELAGRALIFVGLAEGIAVYGLIVAVMILGRL
jgi:V/A-type H+-transporting ATPase subunit K